ncbi:TauD/TfdA family dioxygenase [Flocculibacter collagenilyticus]|uniref:TauD/TfdA family dioxygenase n=1 Tax=Flocculibacter collagenilyticus TaxID=2744479 RepID=UPI0018F32F2B|nr:TauD/TfdA family dioxygenase [Flocculibacter collagenilyticus]
MSTNNPFTIAELAPIAGKPLLMNVDLNGSKALQWAEENKHSINQLLLDNGALLIRGLKLHSSKQFSKVLTALFDEDLLSYSYRSTPRTELKGSVYTATEYHSDQSILQHNENSYTNHWAMNLGFMCLLPSTEGGETPICDSRTVYQQIPTAIRDKFERHGVLYMRNYSDIDLPWSEVFQTDNKAEVEAYCYENNIQFEWLENGGLRTKQVNQAVAIHPKTKEKVWFNQAHLFHVTALPESIRNDIIALRGEENVPRNTYYGDGTPISEADLNTIKAIYEKNMIKFSWQKGDLMLLDNMLFTHGRTPFSGERKVLVGMANPYGTEQMNREMTQTNEASALAEA